MSRIGRYDIDSEIGRGTMGVVYLATDTRLHRQVAVKTLTLPDGLTGEEREEFHVRFVREARAAGALSHPGIVTVYDAGTDPERNLPYIVMEYVAGRTARDLLRDEGTLAPGRAIELVGFLAGALDEAHRAGIVHRDIKPANILIRESDGSAKIADFGVARVPTSTLTRTDTPVGSPAYMSPEQIRGDSVDGRSDLFSLAVILYEALCGVRPFEGGDLGEVLASILHETPVPITKRSPGLPPGLDGFFDRALAKETSRRFPDGASFGRALVEAKVTPPVVDVEATVQGAARGIDPIELAGDAIPVAKPPRSAPPRWTVPLAAAALFLVAIGGSVLAPDSTVPDGSLSRASVSDPPVSEAPVREAADAAETAARESPVPEKPDAFLRLAAKSGVKSGRLTLLVDGKLVYERTLSRDPDQGFFTRMVKRNLETFEAVVEIPAGTHEVVAHVENSNRKGAHKDRVVVDLAPGETRVLRISAGRGLGPALSLETE